MVEDHRLESETTTAAQEAGLWAAFRRWLRGPLAHYVIVPLSVFLLTRIVVYGVAYVGDASMPGDFDQGFAEEWKREGFASLWMRYDTLFYVEIAENGYRFDPTRVSHVSWFPAYPLLMRVLAPVFGNPLLAGVVISNVCLLLALIVLYRMTIDATGDKNNAERTIFYIAAFPTAMFFSAVYTESLFLLCSLIAAYYAQRQRWTVAALAGVVCAMTRVPGVLVAALVGMEWLAAHGFTLRGILTAEAWRGLARGIRRDWGNLLKILAIPSGLLVYITYLWVEFNEPLAFLISTGNDGRRMRGIVYAFQNDIQKIMEGSYPYPYIFPLDVFLLVLVLLLIIPIARRLRESYAVYCALSLLPPLLSGTTRGLARYLLILFPVWMVISLYGRNRRLDKAIRIVSMPLLALWTLLYTKWFFVG